MRFLPLLPLIGLAACDDGDGDDLSTIDGIFLPDPQGVTFVDAVDNPWFPLPAGAKWTYHADTPDGFEVNTVEVLEETRDVNGVTATVVYDLVYLGDELIEETWDWYAQDSDGNVWYLGEDTCEYEGGECVSTEGAWEWGVDGALPGVVMWADPVVDGQPYFQEFYEGEAEDVGEVLGVGESVEVPAGSFTDCVRTADTNRLEPDVVEQKLFCAGIGNVLVEEEDADVLLVGYEGL
jgi:hypothetical protein